MGENKEYIYLDYFKDKITDTPLLEIPIKPQRIVSSRWTKYPESILGQVDDSKVMIMSGIYGSAEVVLDFGKELVGRIEIRLEALSETHLDVFYGEEYQEVVRREDYTSTWYKMPADSFELAPGECSIRNRGRKAYRYIRLFIPEGSGSIRINDVSAVLVHYPVRSIGHFSCSDIKLNRIWEMCAYTTKLCMQDFYEDGIKRDGLLWIGDYRVEFLNAWYCFGDVELARKCLYMFASTQRADGAIPACAAKGGGHRHPHDIDYMPGVPHGSVDEWIILNYCTDFISSIQEYFQMTGDSQCMVELWPFVMRCMNYLINKIDFSQVKLFKADEQNSNGSEVKPENISVITDVKSHEDSWWASAGTFLIQVCQAAADVVEMAKAFGTAGEADQLQVYMKELKQVLMEEYYQTDSKLFMDYSRKFNDKADTSWHVNALSILAGITDAKAGKEMLERVEKSSAFSPNAGFMACWVNAARFKCGLTKKALDDIRKDWGRMLDEGLTTCWERMDALEFNRTMYYNAPASYCHGWTAGPAWQLPMYILGVRPLEPGFRKVIIEPALGDLTWAEGTIPTPYGEIFIHWESSNNDTSIVELPSGIEGLLVTHDEKEREELHLHAGINMIS